MIVKIGENIISGFPKFPVSNDEKLCVCVFANLTTVFAKAARNT